MKFISFSFTFAHTLVIFFTKESFFTSCQKVKAFNFRVPAWACTREFCTKCLYLYKLYMFKTFTPTY